jgi:hypothetical protein
LRNNTKIKDKKRALPEKLRALLWSKNVKAIDPEADKVYIIHQVLSYGDIDEIKLLLEFYSPEEVRNIFINFPKRIYTKPVFLFIKNYLLRVNKKLDEKYYVKSFSRCIK